MSIISENSTRGQLADWIRYHANQYPVGSDSPIEDIWSPKSECLHLNNIEVIAKWKLEARFVGQIVRKLREYDQLFPDEDPNSIVSKTRVAYQATTSDIAALEALRPIPGTATKTSAAFGSCLLMVLRPDWWTVIDRRALETLIVLQSVLTPDSALLHDFEMLNDAFSQFAPASTEATATVWPSYMSLCRQLASVCDVSLRTLDRALYSAKGSLVH